MRQIIENIKENVHDKLGIWRQKMRTTWIVASKT